jgi:predicted RNA-binding protein with PUA domain
MLRGRPCTIRVIDQLIQEHHFDDEGEIVEDKVVFQFKVYDDEEDAEIIQLSEEERRQCFEAMLADLQDICDEQEGG